MRLLAILLLAVPCMAQDSQQLLHQIRRRSLSDGGEIRQNLDVSSSAWVSGNVRVDGDLVVGGDISGGTLQTGLATTSKLWGTQHITTAETQNMDCVAGSTITMTSNGGLVEFSVHIASATTNSTTPQLASLLVDGDHPDGFGADRWAFYNLSADNGENESMDWSWVTTVSAGSVDFCLTAGSTGGATMTMKCPCRVTAKDID